MASSTLIRWRVSNDTKNMASVVLAMARSIFGRSQGALQSHWAYMLLILHSKSLTRGKLKLMYSKAVKIKNILKMKVKSWKQKMLKKNQHKPYQRHYLFKNIIGCMHKWVAHFYIIFFVFVKSNLFQKHMILKLSIGTWF